MRLHLCKSKHFIYWHQHTAACRVLEWVNHKMRKKVSLCVSVHVHTQLRSFSSWHRAEGLWRGRHDGVYASPLTPPPGSHPSPADEPARDTKHPPLFPVDSSEQKHTEHVRFWKTEGRQRSRTCLQLHNSSLALYSLSIKSTDSQSQIFILKKCDEEKWDYVLNT